MKDSHIQWTHNTFNPWEGCSKVSPGCLNCYAETRNARFGGGTAPNWGPGKPRRRTSVSNWNEPKRWNRAAMEAVNDYEGHKALHGGDAHYAEPKAPLVFCASLADWLDDEVDISWLADLLILVFDCGFLNWQMLTKRPENWRLRVKTAEAWIRNHKEPSERHTAIAAWLEAWLNGVAPHNIWIGTSVEDQARADERIPLILEIPAVIRFLSCEPLLERVSLKRAFFRDMPLSEVPGSALDDGAYACKEFVEPLKVRVDWVIVGGESGHAARVTDLGAVESLIWQCKTAGVACFVKQLGARPDQDLVGYPGSNIDRRLRLNHPKGGDPAEWPERFRIFEFPVLAS